MIPVKPICLGLICIKHKNCQAYANVEHSSPDDRRIASCGPGHPLFIMIAAKAVQDYSI